MYNNGIGMRVLINGRSCKEYNHKGMYFIESRHGTSYTVKLSNDNSYKVMAVLSVDGLNVITGKPADESDKKGYILEAYSAIEIKGYRVDEGASAAFIFTTKDGNQSYVKSVNADKRNSGVIGVRVYKQKTETLQLPTVIYKYVPQPYYIYPWNPYPTPVSPYKSPEIWYTTCGAPPQRTVTNGVNMSSGGGTYCSTTNYTVNAVNNSAVADPGVYTTTQLNLAVKTSDQNNSFDSPVSYTQFDSATGWGKKLDDPVRKEYFERGDVLTEIVVYYSTRNALENMGLDLSDKPYISDGEDEMPKAFANKYCKPPVGWNG